MLVKTFNCILDTGFGYCSHETKASNSESCNSRQGMAENTVFKSDPLCPIRNLLCPLTRKGQAHPKEPEN